MFLAQWVPAFGGGAPPRRWLLLGGCVGITIGAGCAAPLHPHRRGLFDDMGAESGALCTPRAVDITLNMMLRIGWEFAEREDSALGTDQVAAKALDALRGFDHHTLGTRIGEETIDRARG